MKISILQENIKKGLSVVSHATGKNPNLPILSNVLFDIVGGEIKLITTNLEIGIVNKVRGGIDEEGSITVDAKLILDYISLLPNQKVKIRTTDNKLSIESENYKTRIIGQGAEDFPIIPKVSRMIEYKANLGEFKKALSGVIFSTAISEIRFELTGVLFEFKDERLVLAATDSFRLSEKKIKITKTVNKIKEKTESDENKNNESDKNNEVADSDEIGKFIVPSKTLQELVRILGIVIDVEPEEEAMIKFYVSDNQILFSFANTELVSRLIEGQYPDYVQIIPKINKTKIKVEKNDLVRAIKSSAIFSKAGVNDINLDFPKGKNKIIVSASSGAQGENIVEIDAKSEGEDNSVVVNYKYLLDGLGVLNGEKITIEVVDNNTPCIIKCEENKEYLYLIMPIKQ
ncbi:DNA polymerase III subunit beta [Patescibacteria group bacterium]|nr:DNA polymerase III subunit beta [Patescibacteria group bacterium]